MISVIVPAHNAAEILGDCLAALQAQTLDRAQYEIIVVDDGSTDRTAEAAREAGADRVLVLPHRGPAASRNAGVAAAAGEIVVFTDADCEPVADWLAEILRPFSDPCVSGVKGSYRTRQREVVARLTQCEFEERYERLDSQPVIDFVDSHAAAFRVQALREIGGFDPAFPYANNEDVDLSYRLARAGYKLVFNRRAAVYHRHPADWRAYFLLKVRRGYWRMVVYRLHPDKALRDSYTPQLLKVQIMLTYLSTGLAVMATIWPVAGWAAAACLGGLALSSIPFTRLVAQRDPDIATWAPLFMWVRAVAFAAGVAGGLAGMLFFRRALSSVEGGAAMNAEAEIGASPLAARGSREGHRSREGVEETSADNTDDQSLPQCQ